VGVFAGGPIASEEDKQDRRILGCPIKSDDYLTQNPIDPFLKEKLRKVDNLYEVQGEYRQSLY
jgi:hypothetical protein